jgi:hypothetical protein
MGEFQWDWEEPLARAKGETSKANTALQDYIDLGPGRSLRILAAGYRGEIEEGEPGHAVFVPYLGQAEDGSGIVPPTKYKATIDRWSSKYDWQARLARYQEIENERREEIRARRRKQLEDQDWEHGQELRDKVLELVEVLPLFVTENVEINELDDGSVEKIIYQKLNARIADLARALKTSSELQRLSADEPTEHIKLAGGALLNQLASEMDDLVSETTNGDSEQVLNSGAEGTSAGDPGPAVGASEAETSEEGGGEG